MSGPAEWPGPALRFMGAAWPAFMAACALEALVFAAVDPIDLHWLGQPLAWSRQGVYAMAFFAFWAVITCACWFAIALTLAPGPPGEQSELE